MPMSEPRVAFYKVMPSSNIPHRKGPIQVIRCCQNCIRNVREPRDDGSDELLDFMCYDDITKRESIWFSSYQSIQYHVGQFEILRLALQDAGKETIFAVALTNLSDLDFLKLALKHSILDKIELDVVAPDARLNTLQIIADQYKTIPLLYQTCPRDDPSANARLFGPSKFDNLLDPIMKSITNDGDFDVQIVLVVITKDHNKKIFPGLGTVCIQMLEPFSLQDYVKNSLTDYPSTHLVKHVYYNIAQNAPILSPHLVAFLLLYLERDDGVSFEDLMLHIGWFCDSSININLHLGFTGETKNVLEFGLLTLKDFIYKHKGRYVPKDLESLAKYANPVTALIAYQGIISRAILVEHNKANLKVDTVFDPEIPVRVASDDVMKTAKLIAENLELILPCRKPCIEIEVMLNQELSKMQLSGQYFSIQEPKVNTTQDRTYWAGEEDSDEEYFAMNKNKDAFRTWIQLTTNSQRLDRLNLFINAIEHTMNVAILNTE